MSPMTDTHTSPRLLAMAPADAAFAELAGDLLRAGHRLRFRADGRSMLPFLHAGDLLTVQSLSSHPPRRGDILLYRVPGAGVVAHRVIGRPAAGPDGFICLRGDASCGPPDRVRTQDILGRVVSRQRGAHTRDLNKSAWRALGALWAWRQTMRQHLRRLTGRTHPPA